jgi:hypothetical protein
VTVQRVISDTRGQLVAEDGAPRLERIVPVAVVGVAVVGLLALRLQRRR